MRSELEKTPLQDESFTHPSPLEVRFSRSGADDHLKGFFIGKVPPRPGEEADVHTSDGAGLQLRFFVAEWRVHLSLMQQVRDAFVECRHREHSRDGHWDQRHRTKGASGSETELSCDDENQGSRAQRPHELAHKPHARIVKHAARRCCMHSLLAGLSILMPVFNERETVRSAVEQALAVAYPTDPVELVIVDDGSTDGTPEILAELTRDPRITLVRHERNAGKGAAVQTALEHATGDYAAIMDADLEYDPSDIGKLLKPIMACEADVVFGTRGFESHSSFSFWYVIGNKGVTLAANLLFNSYLGDIMTCHKVMRTDIFRSLRLQAQGFDIEPEIAGKLLAGGHQIYEVPVRYRARGRAEGKKLTAVDGLRVLRTLLECRLGAGLRLPPRERPSAQAPAE